MRISLTFPQVDVSFFTKPGGTHNSQKVMKPPVKASRAKPPPPAAPPEEDLIALGRNSPTKVPMTPQRNPETDDDVMDTLPDATPPMKSEVENETSILGQKRPAEDALQPQPPPAVRLQPLPDGARPPKRPKPPMVPKAKPPRSIFINRNPSKVCNYSK